MKGIHSKAKPYPKFYYSGRRGERSDIGWIMARLAGFSQSDAERVAEEYSNIYLRHMELGEYSQARKNANLYLENQLAEFGLSPEEIEKLNVSESVKEKIKKMVERCKLARLKSRPIIGLAESKKG